MALFGRARGEAEAAGLEGVTLGRGTMRWRLALVWFMRLLAIVWLAEGVLWWLDIIGLSPSAPFDQKRMAARAITAGFAVMNPVAGVGLWLASAWGGVLWLTAVMAEIVLALFLPGLMPVSLLRIGLLVGLVALYLVLTAFAAREEDVF